jgi:cyclic beta-1,2-glucan synthetase
MMIMENTTKLKSNQPIRGVIFSLENLETHAQWLAQEQQKIITERGGSLRPRLRDNARVLKNIYLQLDKAVAKKSAITPAAEWLLDNFYIIENQTHELQRSLTSHFERSLPKLSQGDFAGLPRAFSLAWELVEHMDSQLDLTILTTFLKGYQRIEPLKIAELWSLSMVLRVILIENLRRIGEQVVKARQERERANTLADQLLDLHGSDEGNQPETSYVANLLIQLEQESLAVPFAAQLMQRLRDQGNVEANVHTWLERKLHQQHLSIEDIFHQEQSHQAAANVTVQNVITSLRWIAALDWQRFFESVSLVDEVLRQDPLYEQLDFATRDHYRQVIEQLARGSKKSETEVARQVMVLVQTASPHKKNTKAKKSTKGGLKNLSRTLGKTNTSDKANLLSKANLLGKANKGKPSSSQDPTVKESGYYLINKGRTELEQMLGFTPTVMQRIVRRGLRLGLPLYLISLMIVTLILLSVAVLPTVQSGLETWRVILLGILAIVPASDLALSLINSFVTNTLPPRKLPRLELKEGIPEELRTLVVIPVLFSKEDELQASLNHLEEHYLANADEGLEFALLSDYKDASQETLEGDDEVLRAARTGIAHLNAHYPRQNGPERFWLFHRHRLWNHSENCWMGWERKRGKLHELNRLLRGDKNTSFILETDDSYPQNVRYILTLDADTRLPRDSVRALVGTLAHPLNHAQLDHKNRVVSGYAILQPRVTPLLPRSNDDSRFRRVFSSPAGLDPYVGAVSDVYFDAFAEGSYTGKGIYDIDAFETVMGNKVPDNTLLSHDLLESNFARTGLVTDISLFEPFPWHYGVNAARTHRWLRGDWQLLPWLFKKEIKALGHWKMLDNLRRSLSAPFAFTALVMGWLSGIPRVWTLFILGLYAALSFLPLLSGLVPRVTTSNLRYHFKQLAKEAALASWRWFLSVAFLADHTALSLNALGQTLWRLYVSRRHLLEWTPAAQLNSKVDLQLSSFYKRMRAALILSGLALLMVALLNPQHLLYAAPFVLLWILSPWIARNISVPHSNVVSLEPSQIHVLRGIARRTWHYFETFVTPLEHYLPPDNVQEDPQRVIAERTSPTNIGLYLLSIVSAHDFGWIGRNDALRRLEETLATLDRLERYHGHFYNWYDTRRLAVLEPRYISTVDSGNLAGHLWTLAQTCREWSKQAVDHNQARSGFLDTLMLIRESAVIPESAMGQEHDTAPDMRRQLFEALSYFETRVQVAPLQDLGQQAQTILDIVGRLEQEGSVSEDLRTWSETLSKSIDSHLQDDLPVVTERYVALAARLEAFVSEMDFSFLYDQERHLLSIGYTVSEHSLDDNRYDLLASEARLSSLVAIAKNDLPTRHWFTLGRPLALVNTEATLLSWSGSMFEYLMPTLVMRAPLESLITKTELESTHKQMAYGLEKGVPWGISESAFSSRDRALTYQYKAFGVPGLGFKRGLKDNLVIAPYATVLAALVDPIAATANMVRLAALGVLDRYGFYDALDFTKSRVPDGSEFVPVKTWMAHHQGMSLVALTNVLYNNIFQDRFHAHPKVRASSLLLEEPSPTEVVVSEPRSERHVRISDPAPPVTKRFMSPRSAVPRTQLLSNGSYSVMMTAAGSGFSHYRNLAVTRWREDPTKDDWGSYIFVRDVTTNSVWSATYAPLLKEPDTYEVAFAEDRILINRSDDDIRTHLELIVSPEDNAELRRLTLRNNGLKACELEVTSYAEIVLSPSGADQAHPAFSKLFVQTEFVPNQNALLATRRPRKPEEPRLWAAHGLVSHHAGALQVETDRARFIGRGRNLSHAVMVEGRPLSGTVGPVLDPIFSLRRRVRLAPGEDLTLTFVTLVANSRDEAIALIDKYRNPKAFERALLLSWTQAQVGLHHLSITPEDAHLFQNLASRLLYNDPSLRPSSEVISRNVLSVRSLWRFGISGDVPILLVHLSEDSHLRLAQMLLKAYEYWRMRHWGVDIVFLNERSSSYSQAFQDDLEALMRVLQNNSSWKDIPGNLFVLRSDLMSTEERTLLRSVARVVLSGRDGTLSEQLSRTRRAPLAPPRKPPRLSSPRIDAQTKLDFYNGVGGFSSDGTEYVITMNEETWTPAPWINVLANPTFGCLVSESGAGYTYSLNSRENQLTPWSNDFVSDTPGEVFYIRDETNGTYWTPTALPVRGRGTYTVRHGQGYSTFEHTSEDIRTLLTQFVPQSDSLKISRLRLENLSFRSRSLSLTAYQDWVLGFTGSTSVSQLVTDYDPETSALLIRNPLNHEFGSRVAFVVLDDLSDYTTDRSEFLGRHGSLATPVALESRSNLPGKPVALSGKLGAGHDPCTVLRTFFTLPPKASRDVVVLLGQAESLEAARQLIKHYQYPKTFVHSLQDTHKEHVQGRMSAPSLILADSGERKTIAGIETYRVDIEQIEIALQSIKSFWDDTLNIVQVSTPDPALDVLVNRWLLYQTLSCRVWARAAFYQAGGAYGFRDQLQDVMALVYSHPELAREQLLCAAARQFPEGDVQHWWHPPTGRGVRTHFSDDRLWLPFTLTHYLAVTNDLGILDEMVPFIEGPPLQPDQEDAYFEPSVSSHQATLYDHAVKAIEISLQTGVHGLPLMGAGDWNDGMNRVGIKGQGESVWLGWFLYKVLTDFAPVAEARNETKQAQQWRAYAKTLHHALEQHAWDGDWYRRAYFDDGTPLGSATNDECRIDGIAQSWAIISGAASISKESTERAKRAMNAVDTTLVRREDDLVLLLSPPFDKGVLEPGYIKGYLPGVRENGGQYTHGAIWTALAFAELGDGDKAGELFAMLNPINHSSSRTGAFRYKLEPYVMAGDVYAESPHVGRGGWSWYTGSASWMYRGILEGLLGFKLRGDTLELDPCIPHTWTGFTLRYRYKETVYDLVVENPEKVCRGISTVSLDNHVLNSQVVHLVNDQKLHDVHIVLGHSTSVAQTVVEPKLELS